MDIVFAAVGGPGVESGCLSEALEALARRSDFEEVPASEATFAIRLRSPWGGEGGAWCAVELQGNDPLSMLEETAQAIAAHLHKPVRAVATGIESASGAARASKTYRAQEIFADGTRRVFSSVAADRACDRAEEHADPTGLLAQVLALLIDAGPIPADWAIVSGRAGDRAAVGAVAPVSAGASADIALADASAGRSAAGAQATFGARSFRRRVVLDDPRLARLAATIIAAKTVWFAPDVSGRVRLKIDASDGGKQISFVSSDEAVTLQRVTNRSWIALEPA